VCLAEVLAHNGLARLQSMTAPAPPGQIHKMESVSMKGNFPLNALSSEAQQSTPEQMVEDNLLTGLRQAGDDEAWNRLFYLSQAKVSQVAKGSGLSWSESQDLFQEVMTVVVRDIGNSFRGTSDAVLIHWMCGIARHKVNDFYRERWRSSRLNMALLDRNDNEPEFEEKIVRIELLEHLVEEARQQVTPADFASFALRWFNDVSAKEAGRILSKSAKAVYRGAEKFLEALRKAGRRMVEERETLGGDRK
jgi:RNA polymerase sigma factor (sigma-70 family)